MCVPCGDGYLNIRVGAVIMKDGKILMAGNERNEYLYSVGGRIKFGETAEEAVRRAGREERQNGMIEKHAQQRRETHGKRGHVVAPSCRI